MGVLTSHATNIAHCLYAVSTGNGTSVSDTNLKPAENLWVILIVAILGSSVVAAAISAAVAGAREAAAARRAGYAAAVRALIARSEYPYRIRRRTSDSPDVLDDLARRGNDLQEELTSRRIWVATEHPEVGRRYDRALADIDSAVLPAAKEAWDLPPVTAAAGMNLNGWGPGDPRPHILALEKAIAWRFGWRRVAPSGIWRLLVR